MSSPIDPSTHAAEPHEPHERLWRRLPALLRPRTHELRGRGELRLIENAVMLLLAALLAVATVSDVVRQAGVNHRLSADLRTWRHYTHHDFKNVGTDQLTLGAHTQREVVCGNTTPGPPKRRAQICLAVTGPTRGGLRTVAGGWYLPPRTEYDVRSRRYGCFGAVTAGFCAK